MRGVEIPLYLPFFGLGVKSGEIPKKNMEDSMKKKIVFFMGILAMFLVFGVTVTGCVGAPRTFVRGNFGDTTVMLRSGLDFDLAFREIAFILNRHGFETNVVQRMGSRT